MAKKIAVMRMLPGLSEFLCLVPALRALRAGEPSAHITLIAPGSVRHLAERFSAYIDDLIDVPYFPGLVGQPQETKDPLADLRSVAQQDFDLLLQMHGNGLVANQAALLMGARRTAGFYLPGQFLPNADDFLPYPGDQPEILRLLSLVEHLGYSLEGTHLEFPLKEPERQEAGRLIGEAGLAGEHYVVLHPGANHAKAGWPPDRFAAIGNVLASRGYRVLITGDESERETAKDVAAEMRHEPVDLSGQTSPGVLSALLCGATLLVANDSGVSHLASACVTPSVIIFVGRYAEQNAHRWAPLNRERHIAVYARDRKNGAAAADQQPAQCPADLMTRCLRDACTLEERIETRPPGKVAVSDVQRAVERLLRHRP